MRINSLDRVVFGIAKTIKAAFTANATTNTFTAVAHGLANGDKVQLTNSGGALPTGLSLLTSYYVISVTADTFQLAATPDGAAIDISDAGTGTHSFNIKGKAIWIGDWKYVGISMSASNTPSMVVKAQGSINDDNDCPDFASAQSPTNRWDNIMMFDLQQETGAGGESGIAGDTGVTISGADVTQYRLSTNGLSWICFNIYTYTSGNIEIRVSAYQ
jgi:hypothetical protein